MLFEQRGQVGGDAMHALRAETLHARKFGGVEHAACFLPHRHVRGVDLIVVVAQA